jgi:hypothetical protein
MSIRVLFISIKRILPASERLGKSKTSHVVQARMPMAQRIKKNSFMAKLLDVDKTVGRYLVVAIVPVR